MRKQLILVVVLVFIVIAGFWFAGNNQEVKQPNPPGEAVKQERSAPAALTGGTEAIGITVGKKAPGFTLPGIEGKLVEVGISGKVTVVNFWATWCPPCREEMPELDRFARKYQDSVAFYAVNIQEPGSKVSAFLQQNQYRMPVLLDSDGRVAAIYGVRAIPTTLILDSNGIIRYRKSGGVTMNELEKVMKGL